VVKSACEWSSKVVIVREERYIKRLGNALDLALHGGTRGASDLTIVQLPALELGLLKNSEMCSSTKDPGGIVHLRNSDSTYSR
jgi:hypothetical protein